MNQTATSAPRWATQESFGEASGVMSSSAPAMTLTRTPSWRRAGISAAHCIVNSGSAGFASGGRLSQIWNSWSGLGSSSLSSGNISECAMPLPAVSHCTSPSP